MLDRLKDLLFEHGCESSDIGLLRVMRAHGGEAVRTPGLFGGGAKGAKFGLGALRRGLQGLSGVENVYTQHKPLLARTLEELFSRASLAESTHPALSTGRRGGAAAAGAAGAGGTTPMPEPVREAMVFIVGGATYAEALVVAQHNAANPGKQVVLGSNELVNAATFLRDLSDTRR